MALCIGVLTLVAGGVFFCVKLIYYLSLFFCRQSLTTMGRVHLDWGSTALRDVTCN